MSEHEKPVGPHDYLKRRILAEIDIWFMQSFNHSAVSKDVDIYTQVHAARHDLKKRITGIFND